MNVGRRGLALAVASVVLAALLGCGSSVDDLVMNPNTKEEIINKLLAESVAKQQIMTRLTSDPATKKELAEMLLGDTSIKTIALDRLTADASQKSSLVQKVIGDASLRAELIAALTSDDINRKEVQEALKKPLAKK